MVLPIIPVFQSIHGSMPPLPLKIDADLPHFCIAVGGDEHDNLATDLCALIDTGAGATIDWLPYFDADVLIDPSILVQTFTCLNGEYAPITMNGVVDATN